MSVSLLLPTIIVWTEIVIFKHGIQKNLNFLNVSLKAFRQEKSTLGEGAF